MELIARISIIWLLSFYLIGCASPISNSQNRKSIPQSKAIECFSNTTNAPTLEEGTSKNTPSCPNPQKPTSANSLKGPIEPNATSAELPAIDSKSKRNDQKIQETTKDQKTEVMQDLNSPLMRKPKESTFDRSADDDTNYIQTPQKPEDDENQNPSGSLTKKPTSKASEKEANPLNPDTDQDGLTDGDQLTDSEEITTKTDPTKKDTDGDGLSDSEEKTSQTDPQNIDSDNDGLSDGEEQKLGCDPLNPDTDQDGLTDGEEVQAGTDPLNPDTDGDQLTDSEEITTKTDPTKKDTDGDGLSDSEEIFSRIDPLNPDTDSDGSSDLEEFQNSTNPMAPDSDNDGLSDGEEKKLGCDPLNPDTDQDGLTDGEEVQAGTDPLNPDTDGDRLTDSEQLKADKEVTERHDQDSSTQPSGSTDNENRNKDVEPDASAKILPRPIPTPGILINPDELQLGGQSKKTTPPQDYLKLGTGFAVTSSGHVVTNYHVISSKGAIFVRDTNIGRNHEAQLIRKDETNDLAILKIDAKTKPLRIRDSESIRKGSEILSLGYPMVQLQGQTQKATFGRVNSLSGFQDDPKYLQVDLPIQPGNSGGPLLATDGSVVGIVTATLNQRTAFQISGALPQNVNYAVKSNLLIRLIPDLNITLAEKNKELSPEDLIKDVEESIFLIVVR